MNDPAMERTTAPSPPKKIKQSFFAKFTQIKSPLWLLIIGFLVLLIPIWSFLVAPRILRLSETFSFSSEVVSVDDFYNQEEDAYQGGAYSKTTYLYETVTTDGNTSFIKNTFDVRTPNDEPIFAVQRLYAVDRRTGKHISDKGDRTRSGYLFAPAGLSEGEIFEYWHINYDAPAFMRYVSTEELDGLRVFKYEADYSGERVDQTENLTYLPGVGETLGIILEPTLTVWIEPESGQLVKYEDDTVAYYYELATGRKLAPWNHFSNRISEKSVKDNVALANTRKTIVQTVQLYIPLFVGAVAVYLISVGIGWIAWIKRHMTEKVISYGFGSIVTLGGLVSLLGWFLGIEGLIRIIPYAAAMNPLTAVSFVLLGVALMTCKKLHPYVCAVVGAILMLIGVVRIAGAVNIISFQLDLVLFREVVLSFTSPARMASYTATSFLLLGAVFLSGMSERLKKIRVPEILTTTAFVFSLIALFGFFFDSIEVIEVPLFFVSAIHTALLFMLSSVGLYYLSRDTSGVLPFTGWAIVTGGLYLSLMVTILATGAVDRYFRTENEAFFDAEVLQLAEALESRIDIYINTLEGGKGLLAASESVERDEWRAYVETLDIQNNYPGIQGVGYSIFVKPENLEDHITGIQSEGFPDYTIRPQGERKIYTSIIFLEPFDERNRQAFGFDMFSNPIRRIAMEQARDTGEARLSGRITLVQEIDEDVQPGFLIYIPYYGSEHDPVTTEARRESIIGYVYSPFRARNFIEGALLLEESPDIALTIYDGASTNEDDILFDNSQFKLGERDTPLFTDTKTVFIAGRPWTLVFKSTPNYADRFAAQIAPFLIIGAGIGASMLIALMLYTLLASRQSAVVYARTLTKDLQSAKDNLEAKLAETERLNKLMIGRELKMMELKKEISKLKGGTNEKDKS